MAATDGDGYQSAWRADHARDTPAGDPWGAPMSRLTAPGAASPGADASGTDASGTDASGGAAVPPEPSTSEPPTAPWPFVTSRVAFPDAGFSPANEFPDAAGASSPVWPGDPGGPMPPAAWPPTDPRTDPPAYRPTDPAAYPPTDPPAWPPIDLPYESPPGVWTPPGAWAPPPSTPGTPASSPPGTSTPSESSSLVPRSVASPVAGVFSTPPALARQSPLARPQQSTPASWPPLPDTFAGNESALILEQRAPGGGSGDPSTGRARRRGVIGLAAVSAVVVLSVVVLSVVGVGIGTRPPGHPGAQTPTAGASPGPDASGSTSAGSTVDAIPLGDGRALIRKIVPAPTGAHVYDVDESSAGVMSLDQYARHYFNGDATELNRLRKEGFQVAASTDYVRPDGIEIATHLVQFSNATGAEDYFAVEKSAWAADDRVTAVFEVLATPDAVGFDLSKVDSLGNRRAIMYGHVGNVVVAVNIYTSHKIDQAVDAKVLRAQLAALS